MLAAPVRLWPLLVVLALTACAASAGEGKLLHDGRVQLAGTPVVDAATGHVVLQIPWAPCHRSMDRRYDDGRIEIVPLPCYVTWPSARLTSPWGKVYPASDGDQDHIGFAIDWAAAGIDALDSDQPALLGRPWSFSSPEAAKPLVWTPDRAAQASMLALIGAATQTETEVADVTSPPQIVIGEARFTSDPRNGAASELVVTLQNQGFGAAYRLRMVTRSNVPALHGLRLSFGRLRPGESRTRRIHVELPRDNPEREAIVALAFEEAHGLGPEQTTLHARVLPAIESARLAVACHFGGQGNPPRVDAGTQVTLVCDVSNAGSPAHGVRLRVVYPGASPIDVPPFDLTARQSKPVNVAIDVPAAAAIDSELVFEVSVVDDLGVHAGTTVPLGIASARLCPEGRLSRKAYLEKRAALRKKHDAGLISDDDLKRYEDQLVGCMEL
jgi:hypothetical protein